MWALAYGAAVESVNCENHPRAGASTVSYHSYGQAVTFLSRGLSACPILGCCRPVSAIRRGRPNHLAEGVFQYFARRVARQCGQNRHALRDFVIRQFAANKLLEGRFIEPDPFV